MPSSATLRYMMPSFCVPARFNTPAAAQPAISPLVGLGIQMDEMANKGRRGAGPCGVAQGLDAGLQAPNAPTATARKTTLKRATGLIGALAARIGAALVRMGQALLRWANGPVTTASTGTQTPQTQNEAVGTQTLHDSRSKSLHASIQTLQDDDAKLWSAATQTPDGVADQGIRPLIDHHILVSEAEQFVRVASERERVDIQRGNPLDAMIAHWERLVVQQIESQPMRATVSAPGLESSEAYRLPPANSQLLDAFQSGQGLSRRNAKRRSSSPTSLDADKHKIARILPKTQAQAELQAKLSLAEQQIEELKQENEGLQVAGKMNRTLSGKLNASLQENENLKQQQQIIEAELDELIRQSSSSRSSSFPATPMDIDTDDEHVAEPVLQSMGALQESPKQNTALLYRRRLRDGGPTAKGGE